MLAVVFFAFLFLERRHVTDNGIINFDVFLLVYHFLFLFYFILFLFLFIFLSFIFLGKLDFGVSFV